MQHDKTTVLPVNYPPITSFQGTACLLATIASTNNGLCWFYNSFVQLYGIRRKNGITVSPYFAEEWRNCPVVDFQCIFIQFLKKKWESGTQFVVDALDSGWYVYLLLDQYYIPISDLHRTDHWPHETLLYGFDMKRQRFYVADFYVHGRYSFGDISFSEFEAAFQNVDTDQLSGSIYNDLRYSVYLIRPSDVAHRFDIELVVALIEDYLLARDTVKAIPLVHRDVRWPNPLERGAVVYGLNNFELMEHYLCESVRRKWSPDVRPFHIMLDHKTAMIGRLTYMMKAGYLDDSAQWLDRYSSIARSALTIRNMLLKYRLTNDERSIWRMIKLLSDLRDFEAETMAALLDSVRR